MSGCTICLWFVCKEVTVLLFTNVCPDNDNNACLCNLIVYFNCQT